MNILIKQYEMIFWILAFVSYVLFEYQGWEYGLWSMMFIIFVLLLSIVSILLEKLR